MEPRFPNKAFMPIAIDVGLKKILLIGGGKIALQKVTVLQRYARNIHVIAPKVKEEIVRLVENIEFREYNPSDLDHAFLVYACTNISSLNAQVRQDCEERGVLINVVDNPGLCDFVTPAVYKKDYISIAVTSNAQSALKSIEVRNRIKELLENDSITKI